MSHVRSEPYKRAIETKCGIQWFISGTRGFKVINMLLREHRAEFLAELDRRPQLVRAFSLLWDYGSYPCSADQALDRISRTRVLNEWDAKEYLACRLPPEIDKLFIKGWTFEVNVQETMADAFGWEWDAFHRIYWRVDVQDHKYPKEGNCEISQGGKS